MLKYVKSHFLNHRKNTTPFRDIRKWTEAEYSAIGIEEQLLKDQLNKYGPNFVAKHNTHMFSQSYEDSAIAEIFSRIGTTTKTFIEIGVEDGSENTTRMLLMLGWTGLWIEGNEKHFQTIQKTFAQQIRTGQLKVVNAFVEPNNIQSIIDKAELGSSIDYLSVDIDQNTSHVFRAITTRARVACVEYNAHFPPTTEYEVPYRIGSVCDGSNWFGASLKTLAAIAELKRYVLVGCDLMGLNAYFVQASLTKNHFPKPFTAEHHFQPPRYVFVRGQRGHKRARPEEINDRN